MIGFSVHDNIVVNYKSVLENGSLIMKVKDNRNLIKEMTFIDVFCYNFENILKNSILSDIKSNSNIEFLYNKYEGLFSKGQDFAWPLPYSSKEEFYDYFNVNNFKIYYINSSYGLRGWIIAKKMNILEDNS